MGSTIATDKSFCISLKYGDLNEMESCRRLIADQLATHRRQIADKSALNDQLISR